MGWSGPKGRRPPEGAPRLRDAVESSTPSLSILHRSTKTSLTVRITNQDTAANEHTSGTQRRAVAGENAVTN